MPIMASQTQNDARGAARILAETAVACLSNAQLAHTNEAMLNNVYRLLEAYRSNLFFGLQPPVRSNSLLRSDMSLARLSETHIDEVKEAFDDACNVVFAGEERDHAISIIERVLQAISYPEKYPPASQDNISSTRKFFQEVKERLVIN